MRINPNLCVLCHASSPSPTPSYLLNMYYQHDFEPLSIETNCTSALSANELPATSQATKPLSAHVETAVRQYFSTLEEEEASDLYDLILTQVEKPLLTVVLEHVQGNQSKCAQILGLNRGTLRKKLKAYQLIK